MNNLCHKGYVGSADFDFERKVLRGKVLLIRDLVTYEATDVAGLEQEFKSAVDDYLQLCAEVGKQPDRPYSGTLQVRISPDLHRELAFHAARKNIAINAAINEVLTMYFNEPHPIAVTLGQHRAIVSVTSADDQLARFESVVVSGGGSYA